MKRMKHFSCFNTCPWGKYYLTHTVTDKKTNSESERQKQRHRESYPMKLLQAIPGREKQEERKVSDSTSIHSHLTRL